MTMEPLKFKLDVFEGPLDLLLSLIAKHKLDIHNIEISSLLEQYLDYIAQMRAADLEIASEFLTMAARLVYIKTLSLLPVYEEEKDLKKELEGQLLEYRLCKEMAARLQARYQGDRIFVREATPLPVDRTYRASHEPSVLLGAYLAAIGRARRKLPPPRTAFSGIVSRRMVSVESRIVYVLRELYRNGSMPYDSFFRAGDRSEMVATFLAMLELMKSKRIRVSDDGRDVYFCRNAESAELQLTAEGEEIPVLPEGQGI